MFPARKAANAVELERIVKEMAEAFISNLVALAFTQPVRGDRGHFRALAITKDVVGGLRRELQTMNDAKVEFLIVERELFESDIKDSSLLEIGASNLLLPYKALIGGDYLFQWAKQYKQRKIRESLTSLVLEHPELSSELLIDTWYFVHDILLRASHILPQACDFLQSREELGDNLLEWYMDELRDLESEGVMHFVNRLVVIDRDFADEILRHDISPINQLIQIEKQLRSLLKLGFSSLVDILPLIPSFSLRRSAAMLKYPDLLNPDRFLYFPTAKGLTPISKSVEIESVIKKFNPSGEVVNIQINRIGGAFNEVYMLTYDIEETTYRGIVKRYPTWISLKWVPLALWTLGTQNFSVLGRSRIERESATTKLLNRIGIPVPQILYMSFKDRLLLREYVEGENLNDILKTAIRRGRLDDREASALQQVGGMMAAIHGAGVTLGDCKPENFIITDNDDLFIIDLEQGARGGNAAWDVAEFLYISGHYVGPLDPLKGMVDATQGFIDGYVGGGGEMRFVNDAAKLKYTKVFTPITLPQVIYVIAKTCRNQSE
jgi:hypothetical protein